MPPPRLTDLDFELAYLILLTRHGLKPLSRWEGALSANLQDAIRSEDLTVETVARRTRLGLKTRETVFVRQPRYAAIYRQHFDGRHLAETPDTMRLQGRLFGYPSCCVEAFIRKPYGPNDLSPGDQELLFHWACPACPSTASLLREYRRIHMECQRRFGRNSGARTRPSTGLPGALARVAAGVALVLGATALPALGQDSHWLPVCDDNDLDYLSFAEEILAGTDWENQDTDQNLVLDGVQIAQLLSQLLAAPPPGVEIQEHPTFGLETCRACSASVNMGFVTIRHVPRGLAVDLPYMALHYLDHGGLGYDGTIHSGRVDLDVLKRILTPSDPPHVLPVEGEDPDNDGLISEEEPPLGTDPSIADTDGDSLTDGPQIAEGLLPLIAELPREEVSEGPYMLEMWMDGLEQCEVCGITLNMGFARIVNPLEGLSIDVPFVGLHTRAHGGLVYNGTYNDGRVLPVALHAVLTGGGTAHWLPVAHDTDGDGLKDEEELYFDLGSTEPDENGNGIPDGRELAANMAIAVQMLPRDPDPNYRYVVEHPLRGHYACLTCGELINMGYAEVVNPMDDTSVDVPYYNLHFMEHGGFSSDREDLFPRSDPRVVGAVLGIDRITAVEPGGVVPPFSLRAFPNPLSTGQSMQIVLSLPTTGPIEVTIYDVRGGKVRDLFAGNASQRLMHFRWDGRNNDGLESRSGVYFCRVRTGSVIVSRKITLIH